MTGTISGPPFLSISPSALAAFLTPLLGAVVSFNARQGSITLNSADVTTALGFTPLSNTGGSLSGALTLNAGGTIAAGQTVTNNGTISGGTIVAKMVMNTATITATGTTQGAAAVLTAQRTIITGGAGLAIKVPATSINQGWEIWNRSGGSILMFPDTSAQFESIGVNTAATIADQDNVRAVYTTSTQGYLG